MHSYHSDPPCPSLLLANIATCSVIANGMPGTIHLQHGWKCLRGGGRVSPLARRRIITSCLRIPHDDAQKHSTIEHVLTYRSPILGEITSSRNRREQQQQQQQHDTLMASMEKPLLSPLCDDLVETTLVRFIQSHPHLQVLDLKYADHLTDTSLDAMAIWLPNLTLDNQHMSPDGLRRLICGGCSSSGVRRSRMVSAHFRHGFPGVIGAGFSLLLGSGRCCVGSKCHCQGEGTRPRKQQLGTPPVSLGFFF